MFNTSGLKGALITLLCLTVHLAAMQDARAGALGGTFIAFSAPYMPKEKDDTAQYLRLIINNQLPNKIFDNTKIDTGFSVLTIRRGAQRIYVPIAQSAASQLGVGMTQAKPGYIDFRPPGGFKPGDKINVTLLFNGPVDFRTSGGLWRDGTGAVNDAPKNVGSLKVLSQSSIFDPVYTAINDLDPSLFSSNAPFSVRNLSFLGNQSWDQLEAIDLEALEAGSFPSGTSPTPEFQLLSSQTSSDPLLYSRTFLNPYVEPDPGFFDIAMGQYNDPVTGDAQFAFIHAFLAVPEPGSAPLVALALLGLVFRQCHGKAQGRVRSRC